MRILHCSPLSSGTAFNDEYILFLDEKNYFTKYYVKAHGVGVKGAVWQFVKCQPPKTEFVDKAWIHWLVEEITEGELLAELL